MLIGKPELSEREALVALNLLPKLGPVRVRQMVEVFGSAAAIFQASQKELMRVKGLGEALSSVIVGWENAIDLTAELEEVQRRGLSIVTQQDAVYPRHLRSIYDPPMVLYVWGALHERDAHAVSMVGSRKTTLYGRDCTRKFARDLARAGMTVVSGLARGIDTYSHEGALEAKGRTVAVLGSGLAELYPPENMALAQRIADGHGAVVSEFPLHRIPDKRSFPLRNRIVAGWSEAILVVESPEWSGSMITANLANENGRNVYAVPGQIDRPSSAGCHALIRDGASLVMEAGQILDDLSQLPLIDGTEDKRGKNDLLQVACELSEKSVQSEGSARVEAGVELSEDEQKIMVALEQGDVQIDQLVEFTGLNVAALLPCLLRLEMKRCVRKLAGQRYGRI